jgi:hypothetical protein
MSDRQFTELDLRTMLEHAHSLRRDALTGRWIAVARLRHRRWEIVLEPDERIRQLVVITAYPLEHQAGR